MDSFLQFWEYIRESLKLVFHLDQIQYFLSFQTPFYESKFQPLSGKHTKYLVTEVLNNFYNSFFDIAPCFHTVIFKLLNHPKEKVRKITIG